MDRPSGEPQGSILPVRGATRRDRALCPRRTRSSQQNDPGRRSRHQAGDRPGPRSIKGVKAGPVKFDTASGNFPKDAAGVPVIDYLGELQTDDKGRLLVLGGRGKSASSNALPASALQMTELSAGGFAGPNVGATRPPAPLLDYANNDTWFDDVSDGPVTAKVKLKSGKQSSCSRRDGCWWVPRISRPSSAA